VGAPHDIFASCEESKRKRKDSVVSMRKRLISAKPRDRVSFNEGGLDLANLGMVEITSEDEAYPIECALQLGEGRGWALLSPSPKSSAFCSTSRKN
jgi:hypothetical protein